MAAAAGRDLTAGRRRGWTGPAPTPSASADGALAIDRRPTRGAPRPHRLAIRSFAAATTGWTRSRPSRSRPAATRTEVDLPQADLHLLNADDLTFAAVRPDPASMPVLLDRAGDLPDPLSRALAGATAWDMLVKGETRRRRRRRRA